MLIAGATVRFAWLAVGLWRDYGTVIAGLHDCSGPIAVYGERVNWYASEGITGPVASGRTVMLPERVLEMPPEMVFDCAA